MTTTKRPRQSPPGDLEREIEIQTQSGSGLPDGRHARRERNREAVVDALLSLYCDGNLAPSSDEVAERSGLSPRSLFRYFDDVDDLVRTAINLQHERMWELAVRIPESDLAFTDRLARFIEWRFDLFDAMSWVGVVARLRAPFQPLISTQLDQIRAFLRRQISKIFAAELEADPDNAASTIAMCDVLCSFEAYRLMREDQGLTRVQAVDALNHALTKLLTPSPAHRRTRKTP
jgi:AcrR family transcriptional regulator